MDHAFVQAVSDLLGSLASGGTPTPPTGGGLARVLREASPQGARAAVGALVDRWFRAPPAGALHDPESPLLNRPDLGDSEKLHAVLHEHVVLQRRWQELSSNESTFYRYRRAAFASLSERLWEAIVERPIATNRPRPEYARFVGRQREVAILLRLLGEPGGAVVGVEGPGGSGKTALLHAIADACAAAARAWAPPSVGDTLPIFDAIVWVGRSVGLDLAAVLDTVARTLDYPGMLGRALEDRRAAVRDLLARRAVLLVVDDVDQADPAVLPFLVDLPEPSRALVASRRRLPADVRALMPRPLAADEVRTLLLAEASRQGASEAVRSLAEGEASASLAAAARYPLLAGWAVGQLRRGQTVERVRERMAHAEGEVFAAMFAASVAGLSPSARLLLAALQLLPAAGDRPTLLAAGGQGAEGALDELLETSLVEVSGLPTDEGRRYQLHPVTRSFVAANLPLDPPDARTAIARLANHYAELAETLGGPTRNWRTFGRLEDELPNVMAVVDRAALARDDAGQPPRALDEAILTLAHGMRNVFLFGRAWAEGLALFHRARDAASRLGDSRAEGWNTYRLGVLHYELGTAGFAEAAQRAREAVELLRAAGDPRGEGHALRLLGRAVRERGNLPEAERLLGEAEQLLRAHGHGDDLAIVQASYADLLRLSGRLDDAARVYQAALAQTLDDPGTEANIRNDLAEIALARGDVPAAEAGFAAAERLADAAGARAILARCRLGQAELAVARQDHTSARALARAAADLFERLGDPERAYQARRLVS